MNVYEINQSNELVLTPIDCGLVITNTQYPEFEVTTKHNNRIYKGVRLVRTCRGIQAIELLGNGLGDKTKYYLTYKDMENTLTLAQHKHLIKGML